MKSCQEKGCAEQFNAKTGTVIEGSKLGLQVWMILLRAALSKEGGGVSGTVEVDESHFGGLRPNVSKTRRKELVDTGKGAMDKTAMASVKDWATKQVAARVITRTDKLILAQTVLGETVCSDDSRARETAKHSLSEHFKATRTQTVASRCGAC